MEIVKTDLSYDEFIKKNREFTGCVIDKNGSKYWYLNGKCYRTDGPACEWANGNKYWYLNGKCHRTDAPAIVCVSGNKAWYLNGKLHRTDGPAVEYVGGHKEWYLNGKLLTEEEWTYTIRLDKLGEFLNGNS